MPATTVHAGLALVVAAALLTGDRDGERAETTGRRWSGPLDRRAIAVLLLVVAFPELDAIPGWWLPGAHRALFHTLVLAAAVGALLYYDVAVRERSWLRERGGDWAVRLAWVALVAHVTAHLLLDWSHLDGVNLLYPIGDQFYRLEGELALSTAEGLVQTFVEFGPEGVDAGATGSTEDVHVATPADPEPGGGADRDVERIVPFAVGGWQLYLLLLGPFVVAARRIQGEPPADGTD